MLRFPQDIQIKYFAFKGCKYYRVGNTLLTLRELLEHGPPDVIVKEFVRINTMAAKTDKRCQQFAEELCSELYFGDDVDQDFVEALEMVILFAFDKSRKWAAPPSGQRTQTLLKYFEEQCDEGQNRKHVAGVARVKVR